MALQLKNPKFYLMLVILALLLLAPQYAHASTSISSDIPFWQPIQKFGEFFSTYWPFGIAAIAGGLWMLVMLRGNAVKGVEGVVSVCVAVIFCVNIFGVISVFTGISGATF